MHNYVEADLRKHGGEHIPVRFLQVSRGDIHETQREEMYQAQSFSHRTNVKDTIIF